MLRRRPRARRSTEENRSSAIAIASSASTASLSARGSNANESIAPPWDASAARAGRLPRFTSS